MIFVAHTACAPNEFQCSSGECIPHHYYCNNETNCQDLSDEIDCHHHLNTTRTLKESFQVSCPLSHIMCHNGLCISELYQCDGDNDCGDWSDEEGCGESLFSGIDMLMVLSQLIDTCWLRNIRLTLFALGLRSSVQLSIFAFSQGLVQGVCLCQNHHLNSI